MLLSSVEENKMSFIYLSISNANYTRHKMSPYTVTTFLSVIRFTQYTMEDKSVCLGFFLLCTLIS